MLTDICLPDVMYFGASSQIPELKTRVFLSPHIGIASLFVIDTDDLFPKGYTVCCNLSYRQWDFPNELLAQPLATVNVLHNIPAFEHRIFNGCSSGIIYKIDTRGVKDRLTLFETNDPDREVVYHGEEPLTILERFPWIVQWDFRFSPSEVEKHGAGTAIEEGLF